MRKNSYKNFRLPSLAFMFILKSVWGCHFRSKVEVILAASPILFNIFHTNSFPYQKSRWKVQVNVVTSQELKMVCGELNEINREKMFYVRSLRKKLLLLTRSEKNCTFKLGVFDHV